MRQGTVIALDDNLALDAALLSHEPRLPFADNVILASARSRDAVPWIQDAHSEPIDGVRNCARRHR